MVLILKSSWIRTNAAQRQVQSVNRGGGSVMNQSCILARNVGDLVKIYEIINAEKYSF